MVDLHEEAAGADLEVVAEGAGYKRELDAIPISIPLLYVSWELGVLLTFLFDLVFRYTSKMF